MQKMCITFVAFLCLVLASSAQTQAIPKTVDFRYSEQVSNASAGTCGCFALQGAAGDLYWNIRQFAGNHGMGLGLAADIGVEHTGNENDAGYGLTLTTFTAGPRFVLSHARKLQPFAQALFGLAHGSGSQFPQGDSLESSANSFALDLGAGADYSLNKRISVRILQLDYLRTALPNNSNDWQNNLRVGAGLTLHFAH
jgi:opacity protein-like surface antigen